MSFQAYLDNIEDKTGLTPRELLAKAEEKGFDAKTKATPIIAWLAEEYGLGRGHAMAVWAVFKNSGWVHAPRK